MVYNSLQYCITSTYMMLLWWNAEKPTRNRYQLRGGGHHMIIWYADCGSDKLSADQVPTAQQRTFGWLCRACMVCQNYRVLQLRSTQSHWCTIFWLVSYGELKAWVVQCQKTKCAWSEKCARSYIIGQHQANVNWGPMRRHDPDMIRLNSVFRQMKHWKVN
jgi:hypothetical protein